MRRDKLLLVIGSLLASSLAISASAWAASQVGAQANAAVEEADSAAMERLRERAERVQEFRKARISHADRQAAADRAKAARDKAQGKAAPAGAAQKDGKGVAK